MARIGLFASRKDAQAHADAARDAQDWRRAAGLYRAVLARHPDNAAIWVQYGHALKESGELDEAERAYREALRLAPANADTHLQLGHALNLQGRRDEAAASYLYALVLEPSLEAAQRDLAALGWTETSLAERLRRLRAERGIGSEKSPNSAAPVIFDIGELIDHFSRGAMPPGPSISGERTTWTFRMMPGNRPEEGSVVAFSSGAHAMDTVLRKFLAIPEFHNCPTPDPMVMPGDSAPLDVEWRTDPALAAELLAYVTRTWTRLGEERPHWSVFAADQFLPQNMPAQCDAFYRSGAWETRMVLSTLARVGRLPEEFDTIFEFGCGLGRMTTHLARHFAHVIACDVSPAHLAATRQVLHELAIDNVELRQATTVDFAMADGFDLWCSFLVLQHNCPPLIALILERALRMLRPGGLAIFQVPTYCAGYRFRIDEYRRNLDNAADTFEMHLLPQPAIFAIARSAHCTLLEAREDATAVGPWSTQVFTFQKL